MQKYGIEYLFKVGATRVEHDMATTEFTEHNHQGQSVQAANTQHVQREVYTVYFPSRYTFVNSCEEYIAMNFIG